MYAYETQGKEDRVWCYNAYLGYDYTPRNSKNIKSVGHYLRYYNGVTPHGQFRNTKSQFIGYTIVAYY